MIDQRAFRNVLGCYPTGVCVVTGLDDTGCPIGMSIGSFSSVSLDPPLVAFFPGRGSSTWAQIRNSGRFCVNVLSDHQESLSRRFATAATTDRFDGIVHRKSTLGLPILDGVAAWIDCRIHAVHDAGDHHLVLGDVVSLAAADPVQPLLFHRGGYGQLHPLAAAA